MEDGYTRNEGGAYEGWSARAVGSVFRFLCQSSRAGKRVGALDRCITK